MKFVKVLHIPVMSKPRPTPPGPVRSLFPGRGERGTCWQFVRYCLAGGVNTIIDVSVLNALLWRFPRHYVHLLVLDNSVAYASGAVSSFFLNRYWWVTPSPRSAGTHPPGGLRTDEGRTHYPQESGARREGGHHQGGGSR
jgi:GtrA-like protein